MYKTSKLSSMAIKCYIIDFESKLCCITTMETCINLHIVLYNKSQNIRPLSFNLYITASTQIHFPNSIGYLKSLNHDWA